MSWVQYQRSTLNGSDFSYIYSYANLKSSIISFSVGTRGFAPGVPAEDLWKPGKYAKSVPARSLFCYWAVREIGVSATEIAKRLKMTQPAVSISVRRGERVAKEKRLAILDE